MDFPMEMHPHCKKPRKTQDSHCFSPLFLAAGLEVFLKSCIEMQRQNLCCSGVLNVLLN